ISAPRRVLEAHAHLARGGVWPPRTNRELRRIAILRYISEQVEAERHRREEIRPESVLVQRLVGLRGGEPRSHSRESAGGDEVRAGFAREREFEPAADWSGVRTAGVWLRAHRVPAGSAPLRLAPPSAPLPRCCGWITRDAIDIEPTVGGLRRSVGVLE